MAKSEEVQAIYLPPQIKVLEIKSEKGFATSGGTEDFGTGNGNWDL